MKIDDEYKEEAEKEIQELLKEFEALIRNSYEKGYDKGSNDHVDDWY